MIPLVALLALPYVLMRVAGRRGADVLGFSIPKGLVSKAGGFARSMAAPTPAPAQPGAAQGPSPAAMAALGPAAILTTPQGKSAVAKGLKLAQSARRGNPKSRAKVARIKSRAKSGDPEARHAYAALRTGQMLRERAQELDDDDFDDEADDE